MDNEGQDPQDSLMGVDAQDSLASSDMEVAIDDELEDVKELEDGSMEVTIGEEDPEDEEFDFLENLAERMLPEERKALAQRLLDLQEIDKNARTKRDEQYAEGLKRSGLGNEAPGGADFEGASKAVHPVIAECCVDFCASTIKELFPPNGPVKMHIVGEATPERRERAKRKHTYLNWQLCYQIREYRRELEQTLTQLPLGGSQYMMWRWEDRKRRPTTEFVPIDKVHLPFFASSIYETPRVFIEDTIDEDTYERRKESGLYLDLSLPSSQPPQESKSEEANDKIEGKERSNSYNEDGERVIFITFADESISVDKLTDGELSPYLIYLDDSGSDVLGVYRNWDEADKLRLKEDWLVDFTFIPWRGAFGVGLPHLIGSLSGAATGALRGLLDSAHINNTPAMLKLKSRVNGQNVQVDPTGVTEIDAPAGVDDIRKIAMPMPYNPPSVVLFQLLGWLDQAARGVVTTAEEKVADMKQETPVGTTLALIEQGSKVYSSIHSRLHGAQAKMLEILCRINKNHLDEEQVIAELGDLVVYRKDFEGPMDVIPVSDPNIFSESQRYLQQQAVEMMMDKYPQQFKIKQVIRRNLELLKYPNFEEVLVPDPEMRRANPVAENIAMSTGRPPQVFPDQDHLAHLKVHAQFALDPLLGMSPALAQLYLPLALKHIQEHIVFFYGKTIHDAAAIATPSDIGDYMEEKDPEIANKVDQLLAVASNEWDTDGKALLAKIPEIIGVILKQLQQMRGEPQDPLMMEVQRKAAKDQVDAKIEGQRIQIENKKVDQQKEVKGAEMETKKEIVGSQNDTKILVNRENNQTAKDIAAAEILAGAKTDLSTGGEV